MGRDDEMTAKEYLSQYLEADTALRAREQKWLEDSTRVSKMTASLTGMPHGGSEVNWSDTINRLVDEERELHDARNRLFDLKKRIIGQIEAVQDGRHRQLLLLRYINGHSLRRIGFEMHMSEDWVKHLHGNALLEFSTLHNTFFDVE